MLSMLKSHVERAFLRLVIWQLNRQIAATEKRIGELRNTLDYDCHQLGFCQARLRSLASN